MILIQEFVLIFFNIVTKLTTLRITLLQSMYYSVNATKGNPNVMGQLLTSPLELAEVCTLSQCFRVVIINIMGWLGDETVRR